MISGPGQAGDHPPAWDDAPMIQRTTQRGFAIPQSKSQRFGGSPQFDDSSGRYTQSMSEDREVNSLEELLERVCQAEPDAGRVSLDAILDEVGCRSFGPLLVVAGLLTLAPVIGDIPGVPTTVGVLVFAIQLLFHREHVWLPRFLLNRSIERGKLHKAASWLIDWP
jgi:Exopolysaccharide synthesis, ExoD